MNPFQWVLNLVNNVSIPAAQVQNSLTAVTKVSDLLAIAWNKVATLALTGLGLLSLQQAVDSLKDRTLATEQVWLHFAHSLGGDKMGDAAMQWVEGITNRLPIVHEELQTLVGLARRFNMDLSKMNVDALYGASLTLGKSVSEVASGIASYTQQYRLSLQEAVSASVELTGTTKNANAILKAVNSTAWNTQARFTALTNVIDKSMAGAVDRQKESLTGLLQLLSNLGENLRKALIGDGKTSGPWFEFKEIVRSVVEVVQKHFKRLKNVFTLVGEAFGQVLRFFSDITRGVMKAVDKLFGTIEEDTDSFNKNVMYPFITVLAIARVVVTKMLSSFWEGFQKGFKAVYDIVQPAFEWILGIVGQIISHVFGASAGKIYSFFEKFGAVVGAATAAWLSYKVAMLAVTIPVGIAGKAISVITGLIGTLGTSITGLATTIAGAFGIALGPAIAIVGAVAAVAAGIALLIIYWDDIVAAVPWLGEVFTDVSKIVKAVWNQAMSTIMETVKEVWPFVKDAFTSLWGATKEIFKAIGSIISAVFTLIADTLFGVGPQVVTVESFFKGLAAVIKIAVTVIGGSLTLMARIVGNSFKIVLVIFKTVADVIKNTASMIKKIFKGDFKGAFGDFVKILKTPLDMLKELLGVIKQFGSGLAKDFKGFFTSIGKVFGYGDDDEPVKKPKPTAPGVPAPKPNPSNSVTPAGSRPVAGRSPVPSASLIPSVSSSANYSGAVSKVKVSPIEPIEGQTSLRSANQENLPTIKLEIYTMLNAKVVAKEIRTVNLKEAIR